jgi:hypothetical protein
LEDERHRLEKISTGTLTLAPVNRRPSTRNGSRQPRIPHETARGSGTPRVRTVKERPPETTGVVSTSMTTRTQPMQLSWPLALATIRPSFDVTRPDPSEAKVYPTFPLDEYCAG